MLQNTDHNSELSPSCVETEDVQLIQTPKHLRKVLMRHSSTVLPIREKLSSNKDIIGLGEETNISTSKEAKALTLINISSSPLLKRKKENKMKLEKELFKLKVRLEKSQL